MTKSLLLDLFSGAGGCARGYADAGFDVIGVDIAPQKHYPFTFVQADALGVLAQLASDGIWHGYCVDDFAAIHASPPCQEYSTVRHLRNALHPQAARAKKLIEPVLSWLDQIGLPWIIENVPGAPLPNALELCGSMFDLPIRRHRWFGSSHYLYAPGPCRHTDRCINVIGNKVRGYGAWASNTTYVDASGATRKRENYFRACEGQAAMEIDWMTVAEMSQAIPPAYTRWIGEQLLDVIERAEMAVVG